MAQTFVNKKINEAQQKLNDRPSLLNAAKALAERKRCDVPKLLQFCEGFIGSMKHNQVDFAEQKSCLVDDKAVASRLKQQY